MAFQWPEFLWGLAGLPLLAALYFVVLRKKQKAALKYASLSLVAAAGGGTRFRRHLPPFLFLLALGGLVVAAARPTAIVTLPTSHETVILAMDVSGSMRATDIQPTRMAASQAAAKQFILDQPEAVRVGIVAFAGSATLAQAPTRNREDAIAAIDRLQLQRGTAVGSAIIVALATIFPDHGLDVASYSYGIRSWRPPPPQWKPVPAGSYNNAVIVLLTDGARTTGPDAAVAAKLATERGVRIYTVGFGTPGGEVIGFEGWSMRVRLDEESLKQVADATRGEYFFAGSAPDLKKVYETLRSRISFEKKRQEITALVALGAAALALLSAVLSLAWFHRIF